MENFHPLADAIVIELMLADSVADGENSEEEIIVCPDCNQEYTCSIYVNQYEGNVEVTTESGDIVEDITVESILNEN